MNIYRWISLDLKEHFRSQKFILHLRNSDLLKTLTLILMENFYSCFALSLIIKILLPESQNFLGPVLTKSES